MRFKAWWLLGFIAALAPASLVLAQSQTSPNYQNTDSSVIPMTISAQSPNYAIDGSIEPIVGVASSGGFTVESGSQNGPGEPPVVIVTPPTGGGGGGGGGGGYEPPVPGPMPTSTCPNINYVWVYRSVYEGTPLLLGDNVIGCNFVHRRLIGDVNDNRYVDDIDLSLFTRHWKSYDRQSDFNEDGLIDDIDLSLFASHWNHRR